MIGVAAELFNNKKNIKWWMKLQSYVTIAKNPQMIGVASKLYNNKKPKIIVVFTELCDNRKL